MATRRHYSAELKAAAMAALLVGQSVTAIAKEYDVPRATVHSWKSRLKNGEAVAKTSSIKQLEIGDLLIEYIHTSLKTLKIQAEHFGDITWLSAQDASELAVLHGVQTDKAIRLLEALSHQGDEAESVAD